MESEYTEHRAFLLLRLSAPWDQSPDDGQIQGVKAIADNDNDLATTLRFLLEGEDALRDVSRHTRKKIKATAIKFAAIDGKLYRRENDGSMVPCVSDKQQIEQLLVWAHDGHGHYAATITLGRLARPGLVADEDKRHSSPLLVLLRVPANRTPGVSGVAQTIRSLPTYGDIRNGFHGSHKASVGEGIPVHPVGRGLLHKVHDAPAVRDQLSFWRARALAERLRPQVTVAILLRLICGLEAGFILPALGQWRDPKEPHCHPAC